MKLNVLIFGQLTDIFGVANLTLENIFDTNELVAKLIESYPALANITYLISVDKKVTTENIALTNNSTVALLPPFSGG